MAGDFDVQPLGTVAKVRSGYAFKSEDMGAVGLPVIKIKNVVPPTVDITDCERVPEEVISSIPRVERFELKEGDTLIAMTGATVGKVGKFPRIHERHFLNQRVGKVYLTEPDAADYRYIYYILSQDSYVRQMFGIADGSAQANISGSQIESLEVPLPPLAEQKAIAAILGTLDDKIELNRRMNATLEAMARALFQSWFVDFDPVRAKLDGRPPAALDPATAALFPDSFQESETGHIPKGWEVKTLSDLTSLITKGTTPTQDDMTGATDSDAQINYVRVNSIDEDGSVLGDKLTKIPESVHEGVLKRSILIANDVLYTIAGTIGRIALAEDWLLPANTNQAVAIIRPEPEIPPGFLMLTMGHEVFREELHNNIVHAVQANLSLGMLSKARVVVPPPAVLPQLFRPIDALLSQISANRAQSRTLATIRDTLLPKLLSGELSVAQKQN